MQKIKEKIITGIKKIKIRTLISHLIITLAYPVLRATTADGKRLLIFTDALTVIALVMIIGGIIYTFILKGDFDISEYVFRRGSKNEQQQSFTVYEADRKEKREALFNYPLFLGIFYFIITVIISYTIL